MTVDALRRARVLAMTMLALLLAATLSATDLPEFHLEVGEVRTVTLESRSGSGFAHGGTVVAQDPNVVTVRGAFAPGAHTAEVTIQANRSGGTLLKVRYASGLSVWEDELARVVINFPADSLPVIYVNEGQTIETEASIAPVRLLNGGTMDSDDESVARVFGSIAAGRSSGTVTIDGVKRGETTLSVTYPSGFGEWRTAMARIFVLCDIPTIAVAERGLHVAEGQPVTLRALTTGLQPVTVEWREGDQLLGTGNPFTVVLPRGEHRITAHAANRCGDAAAELAVTVSRLRRRTIGR